MKLMNCHMRLGRMTMLKCITGDASSDDPFMRFGSIPLAMARTINRKSH